MSAVRVEERRVDCAVSIEMWDWVWEARIERVGGGDLEVAEGRVAFR